MFFSSFKRKFEYYMIVYEWCIKLPLVFSSIFLLSYLFFNVVWFSLLLAIISLGSFRLLKKSTKRHINTRVEDEFKTFIYSLSSSLSIGKSIEHAITDSFMEISKEKNTFILGKEIQKMIMSLEANKSIEEVFIQLSSTYEIESIINFSKVVEITLKQGGSLHQVIDQTVTMIDEKVKVEYELDVIITQKKFELYILLSFVPGMILYLRLVSNTFEPTMYHTLTGRIMMFLCLIIYIFSGYMGKRIVEIEV